MCEVCGGVGKRDADVVNRGCGSFRFTICWRSEVCLVDTNGVVESDRWQRAEVRLENVWKVWERKFLLVEEL